MIENLHFVKDLGLQSQRALETGNLAEFARLMDVHWQRKKQRSGGMSNPKINEWYDLAMASGALGGKLIGAGGGGFLMFYAEDKTKLRHAMTQGRLEGSPLPFRFRGNETRHLVSAPLEIPVAILAGGLATRLRPITEKIPKIARAGRGQAVSGAPARIAPRARNPPRRFVHRLSRRNDPARFRRRKRFGVKLDYSFDSPRQSEATAGDQNCSAPAARSNARCQNSAKNFSCFTAIRICRWNMRPSRNFFNAAASPV